MSLDSCHDLGLVMYVWGLKLASLFINSHCSSKDKEVMRPDVDGMDMELGGLSIKARFDAS